MPMVNLKLKEFFKSIPPKYLIFIIIVWLVIFDFILSAYFANAFLRAILANYLSSSFFLFFIACCLIFIFVLCLRKNPEPIRSLIILLPILLLSFWPQPQTTFLMLLPLSIVITAQIIFYKILFLKEDLPLENKPGKEKAALLIIIILYFSVFGYLSIAKFNALDFFNPKDFGLFNQIFWNTIHGRFFLNSTYGSHFACHNSPFYLLLVPFYYLFPNPLTLLILKIMLLALSAIPFYLITRDILKQATPLPLVVGFLLFPFIVGQNFSPPHESGYAPLFILFTYYFFRVKKFMPFICFLLITISIKEPYALVAVMFGCYAFFKKRSAAWVIYPIITGISWFVLSIALINYFQGLYQPHSNSAWFFVYLKKSFLSQGKNGSLVPLLYLLRNSNLANWHSLKSIFSLFFSTGIAPALLSSISLLGLPELFVNLVACNLNMFSPIWHYNTVFSCFILLGTVEGIKKISSFIYHKKYLKISEQKIQLLLSIFVLSSILIQSHTWIRFASYKKDAAYIKEAKETLSLVPPNASISVPRKLAIIVSDREKYSIIGDESGKDDALDYIVIDNPQMKAYLKADLNSDYNQIFRRGPIILYKRRGA